MSSIKQTHYLIGLIDAQSRKRDRKGLESMAFKLQMMVIMLGYLEDHKRTHSVPFDLKFVKNEIRSYNI